MGVGGREHDYRAVGAPFTNRWQRMDDQVATMRRIWSGEAPFDGADAVGPPPLQPGGPPVVAGVMGPKALARAARWADGVDDASTVTSVDREAATAAFTRIHEAWQAAGRTDPPHVSASLWYALGDGAADRLRSYAFDYLRIFGDGMAAALADSARRLRPPKRFATPWTRSTMRVATSSSSCRPPPILRSSSARGTPSRSSRAGGRAPA